MSKQHPIRNKSDIEVISKISALQQGILSHSLQLEEADPYFYHFGFAIEGRFEPELFHSAWEQVACHYQVMRSNYRWEEVDAPIQIVFKTPRLDINVVDVTSMQQVEVDALIKQRLDLIKKQGYDFRQGSPVTVNVFVYGDNRWCFYWSFHHISVDGWSVSKILGDLLASYQALLRSETYPLPPTLPFTAYIQWLHGQDTFALSQYWSEVLAGIDEKTPLPLRGDYNDDRYAERSLLFSRTASDRIRAFAREIGVTVNTVVQGAWSLLLAAYSGRDEVLFGITTSGRSAALPGLQTVVGLCINTLPFRISINPQLSVAEWLQRIQEQSAESREFEYSPLPELSKYTDLPEGENLFDSILVFENYPISEVLKKAPVDLRVTPIAAGEESDGDITYRNGRNNYPLSAIATLDDRLGLTLAYHCKHYSYEDIKELGNQLEQRIFSLVRSSSEHIGNLLAMVPTAHSSCAGEIGTPIASQQKPFLSENFLALWQQSVVQHSKQIAIAAAAQQLSYVELERISNQLARHLQAQGIGVGATIALCQERSIDWVVSLLAVLKLGAIYLPLDNQQPIERLQQLLHDSDAALLIHCGTGAALAAVAPCSTLAYQPEHWVDHSSEPLHTPIDPQQPAYIIYTSGSTGQPKGVVVSHGALANYLQAVLPRLDVPEGASMAMVSTIAADLGHTLLFGALASGCSLHLLSHDHAFDPDCFAQYMSEQRIDVLKIVPSHLQGLLQASNAADVLPERVLILGGEACPWALVERVRALKPQCRIINHYGPTETTVGVLTHEVTERLEDSSSVPVGLPLANVQARLFDAYLNPVPQRIAGELYLGGPILAQGYLGKAAATAERFIPAEDGRRLYRTGDRACLNRYQLLEFVGRADDQVKIRGYRVELGEVERVLLSLPGVRESVVLALPLEGDETRLQLVGYAVVDSDATCEILKQAMKERLPDYLVPAQFLLLERLPLTVNGKLDKRALPKPGAIKQEFVAPGNEIESILARVWADVLKLEQVSITDNFFELGGDSILSLQIIARAKRQGLKLTPKQLFEQQTIGRLAKVAVLIEAKKSKTTSVREVEKRAPLIVPSPEQVANLSMPLDEIEDIYPLSPMQQGMFFHSLLDKKAGHYINQMRVDVHGLDVERFKAAWRGAISRHEALRANFVEMDGPVQVIHKRMDTPCTLLDWRAEVQLSQKLDELALEDRRKGFDLACDPMLRLTLIRTDDNTYHLIHTTHHILLDGWSNSQLMGEILQSYAGSALVPVTSRYRDYIEWLGRQDTTASETFWRERLVGLDEPTRLAQVVKRPELQTESGYGHHQVAFDKQQTEQLNEFARSQRVTLNTLVQAAWLILLQHYTGQDSVVCGVTVSGRPAELEGIEQQLGLFINTLPLIARPLPELSVGQWLKALQAQNLALREYEYTPLYEIQRWAGSSGEALFDTLLVFENYPISQALERGASHGLIFDGLRSSGHTNYELTVVADVNEILSVGFAYDRTAFHDVFIEDLASRFERLLLLISCNANVALGELALFSSQEIRQIISEWNRTELSHPVEQCIHQIFERQVSKTPKATALVFGSQSLSYSELNRRANRLAHKLREQGVGPEVLVGIAVERSLEMVVGLLATLKAGGAYVPMDPEYPQERLAYMIEDSGISLLLTQSHLQGELPVPFNVQVLSLDDEATDSLSYSDINLANVTHPESLAYVIYTSGSTGKPKGTLLSHQNVLRLFQATDSWFRFDDQDVWTVFHSYAFDFSVWELYGALLHGGKAVIVPKDVARSPESFHALLKNEGVTVLNQTPSAFKQLIPVVCGNDAELALRYVIFGGEALEVSSLVPWFERFDDRQPQLVNMYGITETTVHVTYRPLSKDDSQQVSVSPIGEVIPDLSWYLLDSQLNPTISGVQGELHISRAGLARGYHKRPGLTAERFIPNPFDTSEQGGGRLYRSGDLGHSRAAGVVEYAGRIDHQVKIRGFRIELGEIEAQIKTHLGVREALVLDVEGPIGRQLVAYLVPAVDQVEEEKHPALRESLRERLKAAMPDYMVPAHFVFLESLPLTVNGKLDRKALPKPDASQPQRAYVAPQSKLEQQVATIWADVLKLDQVSLTDNFFELGGHSLLVLSVVSRVRLSLGVTLDPSVLFQHPVLADFSRQLGRAGIGDFEEKLKRLDLFSEELEEAQ